MKNFDYMQPDSIKSASNYLSKNSDSQPFAGGTDLLGLIKDRVIEPGKIVNLKNIPDLEYIKNNGSEIRIGALTKLSKIEQSSIIQSQFAVLFESVKELATPQLKNVGTIGGNLCQRPRCFYFRGDYNCIRKGGETCFAITGNNKYHCILGGDSCYIVHPSDTAVSLIALDSKVKIQSKNGDKIIPIKDFFILPSIDETKENVLNDGEILTEIIIPIKNKNVISKYIKVKERGAWDFALVSIAGVFEFEGNTIKNGRIAFGGVAPIPWMEQEINNLLHNVNITKETINKISDAVFNDVEELDMNGYKVILAKNLVKKLLLETFFS